MQNTTNYLLKKPELTDYVNVEDLNENADIIDAELKRQDDELVAHKADDVSHITSTERTNWNGKQGALPVENRRKITFGTADPSGGVDGDIYFQYE